MVNRYHRYEHLFRNVSPFDSKGHRLTWSTLEAVCRDITNNLKDATELLHNIMSINQPFSTQSTSSTTDFDDHANSNVRKQNESSSLNSFSFSQIPLIRTVNLPVQLLIC